MGLILKKKENGEIKRRLVLDMRRSGGNSKSKLPERLVLPRPLDVVRLLKYMHRNHREPGCGTEFALVDVADAFTLLPVAPAEWKHTMTPGLRDDQVLIFQALLFGYLRWHRCFIAASLPSWLVCCKPPWRTVKRHTRSTWTTACGA